MSWSLGGSRTSEHRRSPCWTVINKLSKDDELFIRAKQNYVLGMSIDKCKFNELQ